MSERKLIDSELSQTVSRDGASVEINIFRLEGDETSTLEAVDEAGASTVWNKEFESERAAFQEAMQVIDEEGIRSFMRPSPN